MSSTFETAVASATDDSTRKKQTSAKSMSTIVRRDALQGVINSGLRQQRFLGRLINFVPGLSHRRVSVEANKNCAAASVFYAPHQRGITPCQFKKVKPDASHVVRRTDEFFVSFIGMSVAAHDYEIGFSTHKTDNELLMYSMQCLTRSQGLNHQQREVEEELEREKISPPNQAPNQASNQDASLSTPEVDVEGDRPRNEGVVTTTIDVEQETAQNARVTTGIPSEDRVYIHYDPVVDARNTGTKADTFVNIPATKRLYTCSEQLMLTEKHGDDDNGDHENQKSHCLESLFVRFTVMEIDRISDLQARAVIGVDHFGSFVSQNAGSIPYIQLLTKAFAVASSVGKQGLRKYSRPDHVLTVDKEFFLANPEGDSGVTTNTDEVKQENFLRYGYYFFLSKPVQAKLYTRTSSADEHIPLMLKRTDRRPKPGAPECEYIPLTEVSYVVLKVRRGCCKLSPDQMVRRSEGHRLRLDNMLTMSTAIEVLAEAERKKSSLRPRL